MIWWSDWRFNWLKVCLNMHVYYCYHCYYPNHKIFTTKEYTNLSIYFDTCKGILNAMVNEHTEYPQPHCGVATENIFL